MIRKIKGVLVVLTVAIMQCQGSDDNSFEARQRRCEARFFDRYDSRLDVLLRIRFDIMLHHKRQAAASKENALKSQQDFQIDQELLSVNHEWLRNNIDDSQTKLLIDFEQIAEDIQDDIEHHFFKTDRLDSTVMIVEIDRDVDDQEDVMISEEIEDHRTCEDVMIPEKIADRRTRFVNFLKKSLEEVINKIRN